MASIAPSDSTLDWHLYQAMQTVREFPEYGRFIDHAVEKGVWFVFGPTDHTAHYDEQAKRAVFNERLRTERVEVVAAIMLHESIHAIGSHPFNDSRSYALIAFEREITAFSFEAALWHQLRVRFWNRFETPDMAEQERIWSHWQRGALQEYVLLSPTYQAYAFGRQLIA